MPAERSVLIEVRQLVKRYETGQVVALRAVDLDVYRGEFLAVMGPSGSGKSTLLSLLGALEHPDGGTIRYDGRTLNGHFEMAEFRATKVGFVFQAFYLVPTLTAIENVQIPMIAAGTDRATRALRARMLLESFGLKDRMDFRPSQLSGGERQRVAISRALANSPEVILADEPTGNLDSKSADTVLDALLKANQEHGATVIVVTHDQGVAFCAERVIHLRDGVIISTASTPTQSRPSSDRRRYARFHVHLEFEFKRIPFSRSDRHSVDRIMGDDLFPLDRAEMTLLGGDGMLAFTHAPLEEGDLMSFNLALVDGAVPILAHVIGLTAVQDRGFQVRAQFVDLSQTDRNRILRHLDQNPAH